jgi:hypothetical protein
LLIKAKYKKNIRKHRIQQRIQMVFLYNEVLCSQ